MLLNYLIVSKINIVFIYLFDAISNFLKLSGNGIKEHKIDFFKLVTSRYTSQSFTGIQN
jgi:hypothetical protein